MGAAPPAPSPDQSPAMTISPIEPIGQALNRTIFILFKPFNIGKWFTLGFCAFLAMLDQCGSNVPNQNWSGSGGGGKGPRPEEVVREVLDWIEQNLGLVIVIAVGLFLLFTVVSALFTWLSSRGKFMFLDGLASNQPRVVLPWKVYRNLGNSLWGFSFTLSMLTTLCFFGIVALGGYLAWDDIIAGKFREHAMLGVAVIVGLVLLLFITRTVLIAILADFVVPAMYLRNMAVMPAWGVVRTEILNDHMGAVVLFFIMKILLGVVTSVIAGLATCLTCCITAIPYLGTVILLPLFVFMRCYALCFIEQFGDQWVIFTYETSPAAFQGPIPPNPPTHPTA
jgi:hypothetical protein